MTNTTVQENRAPKMLTIKECAATGIMPEHALRTMVKCGKAPCITVGSRVYINYTKLVELLTGL